MKQDRFLQGILIGILALVVLSLTLFFIRQGRADYAADDTPEGVARNYALALQKRDYQRAYAYLAEIENQPTFARFQGDFSSGQNNISGASVEIGAATIDGDQAAVAVTLIQAYGGLFSNVSRNQASAVLLRQEGAWKISSYPYPYWGWDWYQPIVPEKPVP